MIEDSRQSEIAGWINEATRLQIKRDRFVTLSIPGWVAMAVTLPKFFQEASAGSESMPGWLKVITPLAIATGWGIFELAEYTEKSRLKVLGNLERAGFNTNTILSAGKFPWIKHFVDEEPVIQKIPRLLKNWFTGNK